MRRSSKWHKTASCSSNCEQDAAALVEILPSSRALRFACVCLFNEPSYCVFVSMNKQKWSRRRTASQFRSTGKEEGNSKAKVN
jgi:hypothetical protein